jgi:hypothetical protein
MQIFTAVSNSTIYDVCLNTYGTLDLLVKLMTDNNFGNVNDYPVNGQEFEFDETLIANQAVKNINIKYATQ